MAIPLRLPTPVAERKVARPLIAAVEVAAIVSGMGALALLSSERLTMILIGVALIAVAAFAMVLSRPMIVVEVAIITMWFDSVGAGPIRTGRVVSALAIFVLLARLAASDWRPPALMARAWLGPAAFYTWAFISGFWAEQMGTWMTGLMELTLGFIYALIIMLFIQNEEHLSRSFKAFVWTGVPIAIISYIFFRRIDKVTDDIGGENRIVGFTGNANVYAALLAVATLVTFVFVRRATTLRARLAYLAVMFGFMVALVTTGSRAGLITMGVIVMYMFVTYPGLSPRQRMRSTIGGGTFVVVGVLLAGIMNPERYSLLGFFGDAGAGRLELWNAAKVSFGDRPIHGYSIGGFAAQMVDALTKAPGGTIEILRPISNRDAAGLEVHNTYFTVLLDLGVIGLIIYLANLANVFRNLWDLRNTQWKEWAWALSGALMGLMVAAFFGSQYNGKFMWTIVGVSGAAFVHQRSTGRGDRVRAHRGLPALRESVQPVTLPKGPPTFAGERAFAAPMDLRLRYPFRWVLAAFMSIGLLAGVFGATAFGTPTYSAYQRVLVFDLHRVPERIGVGISEARMQFILNIARSERYLLEIRRRAGLDESLEELALMIDSTRPDVSPIVRINVTSTDPDTTRRVAAVMVDSLDDLVEQARSGALVVTSADNRAIRPDEDPEYRGPLYIHLFEDPITSESAPRAAFCGFLGAGIGALVVLLGGLLLHMKRRLSSNEDIEEILGIPFVASVPRPIGGRARRTAVSLYRSLGDQIDDACAEPPAVVALTSSDLGPLQARVALGAAAGLAQTTDRPVVIVDLDVESRGLSRQLGMRRRRGIIDVAIDSSSLAELPEGTDGASATPPVDGPATSDAPQLDAVRRPLPKWRLPRSYRALATSRRDQLSVVPLGDRRLLRKADTVLDETVLARLVAELSATSLVVLNMPRVPGPLPARELLLLCDAALLTVLDGWSEIESARTTIDALEGVVPRRVGYVLVAQ